MSDLTAEDIAALKAQGFHFRATSEGEIQFTPEEEAAWEAERTALPSLPDLLERINTRRKAAVDGGAAFDNNVYDSSPLGQHAIASVIVFAKEYEAVAGEGAFSAEWSSLTGFVTLRLPEIVQLGFAVGAHVQACFARQKELVAQAEGGDIAGALAGLETGWP